MTSIKLAGIDFGDLLPEAVRLVREAATKSLSGKDKEAYVIARLEEVLQGLLSQALPWARPMIRPMLDFAVPLLIKGIWHALFGPGAEETPVAAKAP